MMPVVTSSAQSGHPADPGIQRLLSSLDLLKARASGDDSDLSFLKELLTSADFQSLVKVHQRMPTIMTPTDDAPVTQEASRILCEACTELQGSPKDGTQEELLDLLNNCHVKALLESHDHAALKDFQPFLPDVPYEVDEDEESVKIVRLVKGNTEPLGATIKLNEPTGTIHIARVMHGGAADRSGFIHVGDEVQAVNGVPVKGKEPNEVVKILNETRGTIILKLVPGQDVDFGGQETKMRVRAHFNFDPTDDKLIPCREAGLSFQCGEVLHIVSQEDPNWWQARKEGDRNMRAGLVPSRQLQERKMVMQHTTNVETSPKSNKGRAMRFSPKLGKKSKRSKKILYQALQNDGVLLINPSSAEPGIFREAYVNTIPVDALSTFVARTTRKWDPEDIVTYEEVERYFPKLGRYRPLVLLGPPGVGRNELKKRLISTNSNHFHCPIPHTSRAIKIGETDGDECIFSSRSEMEADITAKRFVEFREQDGHLYGITLESIKSVVNAGHAAVICPHPQAVKSLRTPELKPCIVLVKPPSLDQLRETRQLAEKPSSSEENGNRTFTDEDLQEMIHRSIKLEAAYGHYADAVIINDDLDDAVSQLQLVMHNLETEPAWVPASWLS